MQSCPDLLTQVYTKYICERVGEVFSPQKNQKHILLQAFFPFI